MTEPRRYAVRDHPVVVERHSDGVDHARVLDLRTGAFRSDDHWLQLIASDRGVEELPAAAFERLVGALRRVASDDLQATSLVWERSSDEHLDYQVEHEGVVYGIRRGDDQMRYALAVEGQDVQRFASWPPRWSKGIALREELAALIGLARGGSPVTLDLVRAHFAPLAGTITTSGPNLTWPSWADRTSSGADVFVELGGAVAGARLPPPHHGQYVDLFVTGCSPVDVEAVAGPLATTVKVHFDSPDISIAYLTVAGQAIRVLVETRPGRDTMVVSVHFPPGPA